MNLLLIERYSTFIGFFSLIFLWDVSLSWFNARLLILLPFFIVIINFKKSHIRIGLLSLGISLLILTHSLFSTFSFSYNHRSIIAATGLFTILFLCLTKYDYIKKEFEHFVIVIICLAFLDHIINLNESISNRGQCLTISFLDVPIYLYLERSHFGMMAPTIIMVMILRLSKKLTAFNIIVFLIANALFIVSTSMTLIGGIILSIFGIIISNYSHIIKADFGTRFIVFSLYTIIFALCLYFISPGCQDRVVELGHTAILNKEKTSELKKQQVNNLSSAVILNHLNVAIFSLINEPLGYGINKYETAFNQFTETQKSNELVGTFVYFSSIHYKQLRHLNYNDGASNLFKLVAEYGYFSFIIFFIIIYYSFSKKIQFEEKLFLVPIVITQMCRGAGYFNGGFLFCFIFMCYSIFTSKKQIKITPA